jgi:hypothetical protein
MIFICESHDCDRANDHSRSSERTSIRQRMKITSQWLNPRPSHHGKAIFDSRHAAFATNGPTHFARCIRHRLAFSVTELSHEVSKDAALVCQIDGSDGRLWNVFYHCLPQMVQLALTAATIWQE